MPDSLVRDGCMFPRWKGACLFLKTSRWWVNLKPGVTGRITEGAERHITDKLSVVRVTNICSVAMSIHCRLLPDKFVFMYGNDRLSTHLTRDVLKLAFPYFGHGI